MKHWKRPKSLYERLAIPDECKPFVQDYKVNVFEIAWLEDEQVQLFKSDFRIVADYFVQMRRNKEYVPSKETMKHVDEMLKLMSVLTNDNRFIEIQNSDRLGGVTTMCEVLDKAEIRGEIRGTMKAYFGLVADGILEVKVACERCNMSEEEFMKEYNEFMNK